MIIRRTFDLSEIDHVIKNPDVWEKIADKDQSPETYTAPILDDIFYVLGEVDGEIIGMMIYLLNDGLLDVHVQILPEYRKRYGLIFGKEVLEWAEKNIKFAKFVSIIDDKYQNALRYALAIGFSIVKKELTSNYVERANGFR